MNVRSQNYVRPIWLRDLFAALPKVLNKYIEYEKEPPYWNNETASVSILTAAAYNAGYCALADYRTEKGVRNKKSKGRCDFYLCGEEQWLEIEAKQCYLSSPKRIHKKQKHKNIIEQKWCDAGKDARKLLHRNHRARMLFVVLKTTNTKNDDLKELINIFYDGVETLDPRPSVIWLWKRPFDSQSKRYFRDKYRNDNSNVYYPGFAVLMAKELSRK